MNSYVHCIVPQCHVHLENVLKTRLYETTQICACMIQVNYDAIWRHSFITCMYVTSTVWYMKGIWCKQWMTSYDTNCSYESIWSMHVWCVMCPNDIDMKLLSVWCPHRMRAYETIWMCMSWYDVHMKRSSFSGTNDALFGNKRCASREKVDWVVYHT